MGLIIGRSGTGDAAAGAQVRAWARELWRLGDDDSLVVSELACSEPGCPPRETVIVIAAAGKPTVQHKLHRPLANVTREDLQTLAAQEPTA